MPSSYPGQLDQLANPTGSNTLSSPSHSGQHTNANDAIEAVQATLGTNPQGGSATVRQRLEAIEAGSATHPDLAAHDAMGLATDAELGAHAAAVGHATYGSAPPAIAASGAAGTDGQTPSRGDHTHEGVRSIARAGSTALKGDVTLSAGSNVTLTQSGQDISIASTGGTGSAPAGQIAVLAQALEPSATEGADPIEKVKKGNLTFWGLAYPPGLNRHAEIGIPMPTDWNGGVMNATFMWMGDQPTATTLVQDTFDRTLVDTWGSADIGGAYTLSGSASNFDVNGAQGTISVPLGVIRRAELTPTNVNFTEGTIRFEVRNDKLVTGADVDLGIDFRTTDTTDAASSGQARYRLILRYKATGNALELVLVRRVNSTGTAVNTTLASGTVTGLTHVANTSISVRMDVSGTNPTLMSARAWPTNDPEPATWTLSAVSDSTAVLQIAGGVAVRGFVNGSATSAPHLFSMDNFIVQTPGGAATVKWAVAAVALGDGDDVPPATFGTAGTITDDVLADDWLVAGPVNFTPGGSPAAGKWVHFRVSRLGADAADVMGASAVLRGVRIGFTRV